MKQLERKEPVFREESLERSEKREKSVRREVRRELGACIQR